MSANQKSKGKAFLGPSSSSNRILVREKSRQDNDSLLSGKLPAAPIHGRRNCLTGPPRSILSTRKRRLEDSPGLSSTEDDEEPGSNATLRQLHAKKGKNMEVSGVRARATRTSKQQMAANLENVRQVQPMQTLETKSATAKEESRTHDKPETLEHNFVDKDTSADSGISEGSMSVARPRRASSRSGRSDSASTSQSPTPPTKLAVTAAREEPIYEVEEILDFWRNEQGVEEFLVKWDGYSDDHKTWEPMENLTDCKGKIICFLYVRQREIVAAIKKNQSTPDAGISKNLKALLEKLPMPNDEWRPIHQQIRVFFDLTSPITSKERMATFRKLKRMNVETRWSNEEVQMYIRDLLKGNVSLENTSVARQQLLYVEVDYRRQIQLNDLKDWQNKLNRITKGRPRIVVENNADFEGRPNKFSYHNTYVAGKDVDIATHVLTGCECKGSCQKGKNCCPKNSDTKFAYNKHKKLRVHPGSGIYECNDKCSCDESCVNRVVQDGWKSLDGMEMCIFRTFNNCGWAVRTLKPIKKGTFVALYSGEIIRRNEADARAIRDAVDGITYLFDLDFNQGTDPDHEPCAYAVDAKHIGNISHFINHSCSPNLAIFSVWHNCLDPEMPMLALFSIRNIAENEEITFDYVSPQAGNGKAIAKKLKNRVGAKKKCRCGADNCRKILMF